MNASSPRLGQELAHDARTARAQRRAYRELAIARRQPCQQQVGDIRTGDQQDQGHGRLQDEQFVGVVTRQLLAQRPRAEAHSEGLHGARVRVGVGIGCAESCDVVLDHRRALRFHLCRRGSRCQPADDRRVIDEALVVGKVILAESKRHQKLHFGIRKHESRRHHADDAIALAIQVQIPPDDLWIGIEAVAPQRVGQHHNPIVARGSFVGSEYSAQRRTHAQGGKQRRGRAQAPQAFGRPRHRQD